jgi:indole-3-glycerol phosphate synthase
MTHTVLDKICADKRRHIELKKSQTSLDALKKLCRDAPKPRGFFRALQARNSALIAEVKKASPSKGIIRADFDPVSIAKTYEQAGATCLSVLTDIPYFQGDDAYLTAIRIAVNIPILRKDFMLETYQIYESRALGADCVLLIMAALDDVTAKALYECASSLDMDVLVEVHDEHELHRANALGAKMIGVNNRNLKTLDVDLKTGLSLAAKIPDGVVKIAESGIETPDDRKLFETAGFTAFLVGESLMRQDDIAAAVKKLMI